MRATWWPPPPVHPRTGHGPPGPADPATRGLDGHAQDWWDKDNGWPVLQCTRCLRSLPTADGGVKVEFHLETCRFRPTTEEMRRTRVALGPDALPPMKPRPAHPTWTSAGPSPNTGRGSITTCGDVEPNPGPGHMEEAGVPHQVLPLDTALTAPAIRGLFALQPTPPDMPSGGLPGVGCRGGPHRQPRRARTAAPPPRGPRGGATTAG